jgi:hypothetical protein
MKARTATTALLAVAAHGFAGGAVAGGQDGQVVADQDGVGGGLRRGYAFTSRRGGTYGLWVTQSSSAGQRCAQSGGSVSL